MSSGKTTGSVSKKKNCKLHTYLVLMKETLIILHSSYHVPKPFVILQKILRETCITVVCCGGLNKKNGWRRTFYYHTSLILDVYV